MLAISAANRTRFSSPGIREIPTQSYTLQHLRNARQPMTAASHLKIIAAADDGGLPFEDHRGGR
jgi:hypothetical protein